MTQHEYTLLGLTLLFALMILMGAAYIKHLRRKRHNTELWGTIFEGVTHKLVDLDAVKQPEVFIEKKTRRSGQRKDGEQPDNADDIINR